MSEKEITAQQAAEWIENRKAEGLFQAYSQQEVDVAVHLINRAIHALNGDRNGRKM